MTLKFAQVSRLRQARLIPLADHRFFCHLAVCPHGIPQKAKHDQSDAGSQQSAANGNGLDVTGAKVEEEIADQETPQKDQSSQKKHGAGADEGAQRLVEHVGTDDHAALPPDKVKDAFMQA